jgi:hypothetical protein
MYGITSLRNSTSSRKKSETWEKKEFFNHPKASLLSEIRKSTLPSSLMNSWLFCWMLLFAKLAIFLNSSPSFAIPASIHASVCCFFFIIFRRCSNGTSKRHRAVNKQFFLFRLYYFCCSSNIHILRQCLILAKKR